MTMDNIKVRPYNHHDLTSALTPRVSFYQSSFFKLYSHNCYISFTIQTLQLHIAVTNYMSIFLRNRKVLIYKKKYFKGEKNNSIDMYVGKTFKKVNTNVFYQSSNVKHSVT